MKILNFVDLMNCISTTAPRNATYKDIYKKAMEICELPSRPDWGLDWSDFLEKLGVWNAKPSQPV